MQLSQLTPHEQLGLIGLVKLIVHADAVVTPQERSILARLQRELGPSTWNERVKQAAAAFPTTAELETAARQVETPAARFMIQGVLKELAGSDELISAEEHVLRWVDQEWSTHDSDEPESFVLLDDE